MGAAVKSKRVTPAFFVPTGEIGQKRQSFFEALAY
jgi:hypothetical protein